MELVTEIYLVLFLGQGRSAKFLNAIKLATALATTDRASFMVCKPSNKMVSMTTMLAVHAPCKPLR